MDLQHKDNMSVITGGSVGIGLAKAVVYILLCARNDETILNPPDDKWQYYLLGVSRHGHGQDGPQHGVFDAQSA
jgi:hypothetical protein